MTKKQWRSLRRGDVVSGLLPSMIALVTNARQEGADYIVYMIAEDGIDAKFSENHCHAFHLYVKEPTQ